MLGTEAGDLFDEADVELAELALHAPAAASSGVEFYPDLITKAAVLLARLVQFRPLPEGNKRAAYLAVVEFIERNGREMTCTSIADVVKVLTTIEEGTTDLATLEDWLAAQVR